MRRGGGWVLGLLIVGAMAGGGWFAMRRLLHREDVMILYFHGDREPTSKALRLGAEIALREYGWRAGRRSLYYFPGYDRSWVGQDTVWVGISEQIFQHREAQQVLPIISVETQHVETAQGFRVTPGFAQQGQAAALWAKKSKAARVFLIHEVASVRSASIADAFRAKSRELDVTIVGQTDSSQKPDVIDLVIAAKPDLVFYSGEEAPYSSSYTLFSSLRAKGYAGTLLMGEADPEVSFLATRPDLVDGTYLVSPFAPGPPALEKALGSPPGPHVTAGYFAMKAAIQAIDYANSNDPADLRRAAAKLPYFDAQGRAAQRKCALYVARNGRFEFVEILP